MADNNYDLICPACGEMMTKIYIPSAKVNLDICLDGCGGIYFDNREFKQFDENSENIDEILKAKLGKQFKEVNQNATRICPVCATTMVKNYASAKHEIEVDDCYNCGGKFLDHGELLKIRAQFNTEQERIDHALSCMKQVIGKDIAELTMKNEINKDKHPVRDIFYNLFYKL